MKLSLSWIFDHILGSWKEHDVLALVERYNVTTAEIERYTKINLELANAFLARVLELAADKVLLHIPEVGKEVALARRADAQPGTIFLVVQEADAFRWATYIDWHGAKEGLLPAFFCVDADLAGGWKDSIETEDYILELDNKSITNRPDLWGHRGVAREIAALLDLPLIPIETFLEKHAIQQFESFASATESQPFTVEIKAPEAALRFATLYVDKVTCISSLPWMVARLARLDARAINAVVDMTNYVMFDLSQPMHAFDVHTLPSKTIGPRWAQSEEKLELLDGQTIELDSQDLVIADGQAPVALAGIMGGKLSGVHMTTESLLLEAACFDATTVRTSAQRHHQRTEASTRFEKSLDPNQNITALLRFLKLANELNMPLDTADAIISLGRPAQPTCVEVSHEFLEQRIGAQLDPAFVIKTLSVLEFIVEQYEEGETVVYKIAVPTFRATKDVCLPEDIVEEVARFYGYNNITQVLPSLKATPHKHDKEWKKRRLKDVAAFGMHAREVKNYALFDEQFLQCLGWEPTNTVTVSNPVSQNQRRLVTSLVPHLIKNITTNAADHDTVRLFEWNTTWQMTEKLPVERERLAGMLFSKHETIDFYTAKAQLNTLFEQLMLGIEWRPKKSHQPVWQDEPWYHPYQSACLYWEDIFVGVAGKVNEAFLSSLVAGDAFVFELDVEKLLSFAPATKFQQLPKFPESSLDVSMLVPLAVTVTQLTDCIVAADARIFRVALVDVFQKDEWPDKKSVTMRLQARDDTKTLTKDDIDHIYKHVVVELERLGAVIR